MEKLNIFRIIDGYFDRNFKPQNFLGPIFVMHLIGCDLPGHVVEANTVRCPQQTTRIFITGVKADPFRIRFAQTKPRMSGY